MSDRESKPGYQVAEFQSKSTYDRWLETQGSTIRIVDVCTTKRWSILAGFLGRTKTYTVTYEQNRAPGERRTLTYCPQCGVAADPMARFCLGCGQELRKDLGQVLPSAVAVASPSSQSTPERYEIEGRGIAGWAGFGLGTLIRKARHHPYLALSTTLATIVLLYWLSTAPTGLQQRIAAGNTQAPTALDNGLKQALAQAPTNLMKAKQALSEKQYKEAMQFAT